MKILRIIFSIILFTISLGLLTRAGITFYFLVLGYVSTEYVESFARSSILCVFGSFGFSLWGMYMWPKSPYVCKSTSGESSCSTTSILSMSNLDSSSSSSSSSTYK